MHIFKNENGPDTGDPATNPTEVFPALLEFPLRVEQTVHKQTHGDGPT
jgi:hypothetical protein